MLDFESVTARVKKALDIKSDMQLAELLNITRSAYAQRKGKGSIPYEQIITLLAEKGVSLDQVIFGEGWEVSNQLAGRNEDHEPATVVPPVMQLGMRASFEMQDLAEQCGEPRESVSLSDVEYTAHDAIEVCQEQGQPLDRFFMPMFKSIARAGFRRTQRLKADLAAKRAKRQDDESGE